MRGLTDLERYALLLTSNHTLTASDPELIAVTEKLVLDGRAVWVRCPDCEARDVDRIWWHSEPTAAGKLALELDTIARTKTEL